MPRFYFDCLTDGHLYSDTVGITLQLEDVADQAQALLMQLLQENISTMTSTNVIVTVRDEKGSLVLVTHGMIGQHSIVNDPELMSER